jgi:hypothetical protein
MKYEQVHRRADRPGLQPVAQVEAGQGAEAPSAVAVNVPAPMACSGWVVSPVPLGYPAYPLAPHPFALAWAQQLQWVHQCVRYWAAYQSTSHAARQEAELAARRERWIRRLAPGLN